MDEDELFDAAYHEINVMIDEIMVDMKQISDIAQEDEEHADALATELETRIGRLHKDELLAVFMMTVSRLMKYGPGALSSHFFEEHPEYKRNIKFSEPSPN